MSESAKKIRVTLVKGLMGTKQSHRASVRGLGLRWRNHSVVVPDTPAVRGMINRASYLLRVDGVAADT